MTYSAGRCRLMFGALVYLSCTALSYAEGDITVNCNLPGNKGKIANALKQLDPVEGHTVRVSGYCHENLAIGGFDRLFLIASAGTVIEDASSGVSPVIYVGDSRRVVIQGFTIRGGSNAVNCDNGSLCRLVGDTIEQTARGAGVSVRDSQVELTDVILQSNADWGIYASESRIRARNVTIRDVRGGTNEPAGIGIALDSTEFVADNLTIQNAGGSGVYAFKHSFVQINSSALTDNGGWGIAVLFGSTGSFDGTTVSKNKATGVFIDDVSSVVFNGGNYTLNGGSDIFCGKQSAAARWIETTQHGSTNCPVPAPDI